MSSSECFLHARQGWLRVEAIDRPDLGGWDVVLRIDGTYFSEEVTTKAELVKYFADWIREELGVAS
jgi:hypothetical protein